MDPLTDKLKGVINLDDEEESVLQLADGELHNDLCLVVRVLTRKPVYLITFQKKMKPHWDGRFPSQIFEIESGLFMVSFDCEGNKFRVLNQESWHFQNHHIVLHQPTTLQSVELTELNFSPF